MKNAKIKSKKVLKTTKPRRVAGVQVRSGIKAGGFYNPPGPIGGPGGDDPRLGGFRNR